MLSMDVFWSEGVGRWGVRSVRSLKSCTWKHGCQNHNYVQGGQGVQY